MSCSHFLSFISVVRGLFGYFITAASLSSLHFLALIPNFTSMIFFCFAPLICFASFEVYFVILRFQSVILFSMFLAVFGFIWLSVQAYQIISYRKGIDFIFLVFRNLSLLICFSLLNIHFLSLRHLFFPSNLLIPFVEN